MDVEVDYDYRQLCKQFMSAMFLSELQTEFGMRFIVQLSWSLAHAYVCCRYMYEAMIMDTELDM